MIRLAVVLSLLASPALAAEPTFTKDEVQAAYALGRADAAREQLSATPAARSLAAKMQPPAPTHEQKK